MTTITRPLDLEIVAEDLPPQIDREGGISSEFALSNCIGSAGSLSCPVCSVGTVGCLGD